MGALRRGDDPPRVRRLPGARTGLDMDQAFTLLRQHARTTNQRLTDVARYVIDSPTAEFPPAPRR